MTWLLAKRLRSFVALAAVASLVLNVTLLMPAIHDAAAVRVTGLASQLTVTGAEGTTDRLFVNGGNGDDVIDASAVQAGSIQLTLDGGAGDDIVIHGFVTGAGTDDRIDPTGRGLSFDWLMAHVSEVDGDTLLDLGGQQIVLRGLSASALHQDDFLM